MEVEESANVAQAPDSFVLAKVSGAFLKFASVDQVPAEGVELGPLDAESLGSLTLEQMGEVYGSVAGVNPKKFKTKEVGIESILYQARKMPTFDPSRPRVAATAPAPKSKKDKAARSADVSGGKFARKEGEVFELVAPENSASVVAKLAPQAQELLLIIAELAKEKGSATVLGADLNAALSRPEVKDRLRTKQDPLRILQYYKGKLIGSGLLRNR